MPLIPVELAHMLAVRVLQPPRHRSRPASTAESILSRALGIAAGFGPNVAIETRPSQSEQSTIFYIYDADVLPREKVRIGWASDRDVVAVATALLAEFGKREMGP